MDSRSHTEQRAHKRAKQQGDAQDPNNVDAGGRIRASRIPVLDEKQNTHKLDGYGKPHQDARNQRHTTVSLWRAFYPPAHQACLNAPHAAHRHICFKSRQPRRAIASERCSDGCNRTLTPRCRRCLPGAPRRDAPHRSLSWSRKRSRENLRVPQGDTDRAS